MFATVVFRFWIIWSIIQVSILQENITEEDDPDYGKTWMYFPDGDGQPQVVNLTETETNTSQGRSSNTDSDVTFQLYTRRNKDRYSELVLPPEEDENRLKMIQPFDDEYFNPKQDVKILTHGWMSSGQSESVMLIKNAYLEDREVNVIVADWEPLAANYFYLVPAYNTKIVGNRIGRMVNYLVSNQKMSHSQFHIIGHSLGAHVSGFAGNTVRNGKIARITGLDPAKPGFEDTSPENRLDEDDAEFVDVIHTCAGVLGYSSPLGKADFYPNKGTPPQPGCGGVFQVLDACSHGRAYVYFAESIRKKDGFLSRRCANSYEAKASSCGGNGTAANKSILMGDAVPFDIEGVFYLPTNDKEPYANNFN